MTTLGIDIGGSGIKGAPVDVRSGTLAAQRLRLPTPQPSNVRDVVATVADIANHFPAAKRVGVAFPGVIVDGVSKTAANVDHSWIGAEAAQLLGAAAGRPVTVVNDADAAGMAEMAFGAGRGHDGVIVVLALGTGIGSALFHDGVLVPNTELGQIRMWNKVAEAHASAHARETDGLSWSKWAGRVQAYLEYVEQLVRPRLFVIGGGISKNADKFLPKIHIETPITATQLHNDAGIVGAALAAPGAG